MIDTFLVAEKTIVHAKGDGSPLDVSGAPTRVFLLGLNITQIIEQESLDVQIFGSPDGNTWGAKPIVGFSQIFYRGEWPLLLDLRGLPDVRLVRAHWEVNRWGRSSEPPMFEFQVSLKEIPAEILREAKIPALAGIWHRFADRRPPPV